MSITLLLTANASGSDTNIQFSSSQGLDSTYKCYLFYWHAHLNTDGEALLFSCAIDGPSSPTFNRPLTNPFYKSYNLESGGTPNLAYDSSYDGASTTTGIHLNLNWGNDADQAAAGMLYLFNPSGGTYVKHYLSYSNNNTADNGATLAGVGGYVNDANDITNVKFATSSGSLDGSVSMYGVG